MVELLTELPNYGLPTTDRWENVLPVCPAKLLVVSVNCKAKYPFSFLHFYILFVIGSMFTVHYIFKITFFLKLELYFDHLKHSTTRIT